ncbi:M23 family metallopeptidase [Actinokineospora sp. NBRC 105648]|uniref:M23 family metallopeptidase n=1 Tax=Actinokineospora sp. NBRC 105648 TaxID=3032206 RepID=UPI0025545199|nr:M23 family metallopeptidase [Actinokineospora sp. NBRC 105648]
MPVDQHRHHATRLRVTPVVIALLLLASTTHAALSTATAARLPPSGVSPRSPVQHSPIHLRTSGPPSAPPLTAPAAPFSWPVAPPRPVARPFEAPLTPYGPGHRGVDIPGTPGEPVYAAADGVVAFAGQVVDRAVVSVAHSPALRTTYEPLVPSVPAGRPVRRGDQIGVLAAGHKGCPAAPACLHWGLRRDHEYLDPLVLLRAVRVRLLPALHTPSRADARSDHQSQTLVEDPRRFQWPHFATRVPVTGRRPTGRSPPIRRRRSP